VFRAHPYRAHKHCQILVYSFRAVSFECPKIDCSETALLVCAEWDCVLLCGLLTRSLCHSGAGRGGGGDWG
jgi:hypothetical protein